MPGTLDKSNISNSRVRRSNSICYRDISRYEKAAHVARKVGLSVHIFYGAAFMSDDYMFS